VKNSLRLALSAFVVAFVTLAASGAPLPFVSTNSHAPLTTPARMAPPPIGADRSDQRELAYRVDSLASLSRQ